MERFRNIFNALTYRERVLLFSVTATATVALFHFLVLAQFGQLQQVRTELAHNEKIIFEKEELFRQLTSVKNDDHSASPLWQYLKENLGLSGFVRKVSSIGNREGILHVRKILSEKVERLPEYDKTSIQLELEAPFNAIGGFLEELEKSPLLTRVEGVEIFRMEKELRLCHAKITLSSYSWRANDK